MTLPYKMIVVCRGRALLCPLDPDMADVLFIGGVSKFPLSFLCWPTYKVKCKFNLEVQLRSVFSMKKTLRVCPAAGVHSP